MDMQTTPPTAPVKGVSQLRPKYDPLLSNRLLESILTVGGNPPSCLALLTAYNLSHEQDTVSFWRKWISKSTYSGAWREAVHRSALALKLLIFEPTGDSGIFSTLNSRLLTGDAQAQSWQVQHSRYPRVWEGREIGMWKTSKSEAAH
jgi:hypothetical protein